LCKADITINTAQDLLCAPTAHRQISTAQHLVVATCKYGAEHSTGV
jgi:hypothetical protein